MIIINKLHSLPAALKASVVFLLGNIISKALAYITTPIYTRILSSEEYGQSAVFYSWQQILGIVAMFNLSAGVFNNGMVDYPDKRNEYSFSMLGLSWLITSFFVVILLFFYYLGGWRWLEMPISFIILMCLTFYFQPAYKFWIAKQRYEYRYKYPLLFAIILAVGSPLVAIMCIILFPENKVNGRLWGAEGFSSVVFMFFILYIISKSHYKLDTSYWKSAFLFNLPLLPHYLSILILASCDRIMISQLVGNQQAAYYSVAYSVALVVTIVWSAVNSSLVPYTYEKCKIREYQSISKVTLPILSLFALICFLSCLLAPEAIRLMATDEYMEAVYIVPPVVGGVFFQVQYYIYANIVFYYKKPQYVMFASLTSAICKILLNFLLIPLFGYMIAGVTTMICYMIQAVIDYYAMRKVVGCSIYNMRAIILLSLVVVMGAFVLWLLYPYFYIRYFLVFILFMFAVINRKNLMKLVTI